MRVRIFVTSSILHNWYAGTSLQHHRKILRGPVLGGGVSSSLLTAKLQSAVANFAFKASLTLHFHVKNGCLCPKNLRKWPETMLNILGIILYLLLNKENDELLVPKYMMNMKWYNRVFWSCVRIDGFGQ